MSGRKSSYVPAGRDFQGMPLNQTGERILELLKVHQPEHLAKDVVPDSASISIVNKKPFDYCPQGCNEPCRDGDGECPYV